VEALQIWLTWLLALLTLRAGAIIRADQRVGSE